MENKIKNRVFLLLAVSLTALCLIACGCTSQEESPAEVAGTADLGIEKPEMTGEIANSGELPPDGPVGIQGPEAAGGPGEGRIAPDFASAAETLGVTEDELTAALGDMSEGVQMDLDAAALNLGVTVEELEAALGISGDMPSPGTPPVRA